MARVKMVAPTKRRVWRITPDAPQGEFIDPDATPQPKPESVWALSSFELTDGLDVYEDGDTVPAALLDELLKKPAN